MASNISETSSIAPPDPAPPPTQSLARAVYARRHEYIRPHRIRIKVGTWNVAGLPETCDDLTKWFVDGEGLDNDAADSDIYATGTGAVPGEDGHARALADGKIGLYVLGMQEVIDINNRYEYVTYPDPGRRKRWLDTLQARLPDYKLLAEEKVRGLLLVILASADVAEMTSNIRVSSVGTGMFGLLANKGAIGTQMLLGETTRLAFVNSHLASGPTQQDRRIWDVDATAGRMKFPAVKIPGAPDDDDGEEKLGDEDIAFWFGDLNFRIGGIPGDQVRQLIEKFCTGEYVAAPKRVGAEESPDGRQDSDDESEYEDGAAARKFGDVDLGESEELPNPDDFEAELDPASLQAILESLKPHDQLLQAVKKRQAFYEGWQEGPIKFMPTYKYDVNTVDTFDSSVKQRAPSWCDRILYRAKAHAEAWQGKLREEAEAKRRDEEMKERGVDETANDDHVLFDYDPDQDGDDAPPEGRVGYDYDAYDDNDDGHDAHLAADTEKEMVKLEAYTSHQRICTSDHKPVVAVFTVDFDGVDPKLKASVHAEVARELDRAENEGRPRVDVVDDRNSDEPGVDFGNVTYRVPHTAGLTVANTGSVTARCAFVPKSSPSWLTAAFLRPGLAGDSDMEDTAPDTGKAVEIDPGDTITVQLTVQVSDVEHIRRLNAGVSKLEDVLVLRVEDGRDHFVHARGTWVPTSFGRSIEDLVSIPESGIRSPSPKPGHGKDKTERGATCPFPRELMALCDALRDALEVVVAEDEIDSQDLRNVSSWPFERKLIDRKSLDREIVHGIDALDTRADLLDSIDGSLTTATKLEVLSHLLADFLGGIHDGIITPPLFDSIVAAVPNLSSISASSPNADLDSAKDAILDVLQTSPHHNIAFVFLADTLSRLCARLAPLPKLEPPAPEIRKFRTFSFRTGIVAGNAGRGGRERKIAEIVGKAVCRGSGKGAGDKIRGVMEVFLRRVNEE